jgi:hypothetical protein
MNYNKQPKVISQVMLPNRFQVNPNFILQLHIQQKEALQLME